MEENFRLMKIMIQEEQSSGALNNSNIQVLMNLGLTSLQATIYLTLVRLGKAEAQRIANVSHVARSQVYQVMPTLLELGLTEKSIDRTTLYEATPLKESLSLLLQNKKQACIRLEQEASVLLNGFHNNELSGSHGEKQEFKIISEVRLFRKKQDMLTKSAQTSIDGVIPRKCGLINVFASIDRSSKKKLKMRFIAQKVGEELQTKEQDFAEKLGVELRYFPKSVPFGMAIFDNKEVTMCLCEKDEMALVPSLWSNNPNFVRLANTFFENLWIEASIIRKVTHV
jgi:sugar-specific transcriptional regulator TrmB